LRAPGGLGELLGGAAAGTALSGGLAALIKEFQQRGLGQAAQSWVGTGPNQKIASNDLARALGTDTIDALSKQTGVGREDLLAGLSQHLPDLVDQLSPNGRLPPQRKHLNGMTCQRDNTRWFMTRLKSRGVSVTTPPERLQSLLAIEREILLARQQCVFLTLDVAPIAPRKPYSSAEYRLA
jgi:uncharacterized protein YidB (DUF937 family)